MQMKIEEVYGTPKIEQIQQIELDNRKRKSSDALTCKKRHNIKEREFKDYLDDCKKKRLGC